MAELNRVVVHFLDGRIEKGTTQDFSPTRPQLHLQPLAPGPAVTVQTNRLKAIYFVKDFAGAPDRRDIRGFVDGPAETGQGRKLAVLFRDGELLCGYSLVYSAGRESFFMFPADTGGNNLRIFVLTAATRQVAAGPGAEALAERTLRGGNAAA